MAAIHTLGGHSRQEKIVDDQGTDFGGSINDMTGHSILL